MSRGYLACRMLVGTWTQRGPYEDSNRIGGGVAGWPRGSAGELVLTILQRPDGGDAASTLSRDSSAGDEQHSGVRTLVLHLLPGALITAFYAGAAPVVRSLGFPSLMAIFLALGFVLIPFELGYLIY